MKCAALFARSIAKYFITSICPFVQEKFCAAASAETQRTRTTTDRVICRTSSGVLSACKHESDAQVVPQGSLPRRDKTISCGRSEDNLPLRIRHIISASGGQVVRFRYRR